MKAYPLIYSRTKNEDFVPDFLARPADLDWKTALKFVGDAMKSLDSFNNVRYSAFVVGDYCICGGISCITKILFEKVKAEMPMIAGLTEGVEEYLNDCKGRNIAAFVGFAIKRTDIRSGKIPDLKYSNYWQVYLEYLKKQWFESRTESEKISFPPIEVDEKTYSSLYTPKFLPMGEKYVVTSFNDNPQSTIDYFFNRIINNADTVSFISNVKRRSDWDCMTFKYAHVSDELMASLNANPSVVHDTVKTADNYHFSQNTDSGTGMSNSKFSEYKRTSVSTGTPSGMNERYSNNNFTNRTPKYEEPVKKKNILFPIFLAAAAVVCIIIFILIQKH